MPTETGHARNIAYFQTLISFVTGYGFTYAPTNAAISLVNLNAKLTEANARIDSVTTALGPSKMAINNRETAFDPLRKLTTRVVNYYASTGTEDNNIDDAKTYSRKIQGTRKSKPKKDDPGTPQNESQSNHSASQQSFTQMVEHLDNLVEILGQDPLYDPAETALKITTLTTLSTDLKTANTAVTNAYSPLSTARIKRDAGLYDPDTGLVALAGLVKKYVKAVFGADSPEFQQISGLKFTGGKS